MRTRGQGHCWAFVQGHSFILARIFCSKAAGCIEAKFHVERIWIKGIKVSSNGLGHMTKMAAMPIYSNNPLKSSCTKPTGG